MKNFLKSKALCVYTAYSLKNSNNFMFNQNNRIFHTSKQKGKCSKRIFETFNRIPSSLQKSMYSSSCLKQISQIISDDLNKLFIDDFIYLFIFDYKNWAKQQFRGIVNKVFKWQLNVIWHRILNLHYIRTVLFISCLYHLCQWIFGR